MYHSSAEFFTLNISIFSTICGYLKVMTIRISNRVMTGSDTRTHFYLLSPTKIDISSSLFFQVPPFLHCSALLDGKSGKCLLRVMCGAIL